MFYLKIYFRFTEESLSNRGPLTKNIGLSARTILSILITLQFFLRAQNLKLLG